MNWKRKIDKFNEHHRRHDTLTEEDKDMARLAKESYALPDQRQSFKDYEYLPEHSGNNVAIYHNKNKKKKYLVFKGTSTSEDFMPDLHIASGHQKRHPAFQMAEDTYKSLSAINPDETWETVGHSLGGTKAMYVAEKHNLKSHAFNPGYNNITDDELNPEYKNHNIYIIKGDPVSNSILTENLANPKVLDAVSTNPITNHSINSF